MEVRRLDSTHFLLFYRKIRILYALLLSPEGYWIEADPSNNETNTYYATDLKIYFKFSKRIYAFGGYCT